MTYRVGATAGESLSDGISIGTITNWAPGSQATAMLTCGWWRMETQVDNRFLWAYGATGGVTNVGSELKVITNTSTSVVSTTSSGLGWVVDEWRFVATLHTQGFDAPAPHKVGQVAWSGTLEQPPTLLFNSTTLLGSGTCTPSTEVVIGKNGGGGTAGFRGFLGPWAQLHTTHLEGTPFHPLGLSTLGNTSDNEARQILRDIVMPMYRLDYSGFLNAPVGNNATPGNETCVRVVYPLEGLVGFNSSTSGTGVINPQPAATRLGSAAGSNGYRIIHPNPIMMHPRPRR